MHRARRIRLVVSHRGEDARLDTPIRSNHFGRMRSRCVGPLRASPAGRRIASAPVRPDRRAGFARSSSAMHPDRRVWPDASVHQIWVTDASVQTGAMSAHVLPCGYRPCMAATQPAIARLVKGWACRLAVCCAAPPRRSTPWHWQPAAPPDAWRVHFNAGAWTSTLASNAIRPF
jgi:hypothetical protein